MSQVIIQLQIRRDSEADWTTNDPTLISGEWAVETDTRRVKLGDGSTAWTSLPYLTGFQANPDLVDLNVPLIVGGGATPATLPHLELGFSDIQSKSNTTTAAAININPLGGNVVIGLTGSTMTWDNTQLTLRESTNIFFEALVGEVNIWAGDVADPTANDTIEAKLFFLSQDQNQFGFIGFDDNDSLDIINNAYEADLNLFVTDSLGNADYGVTLNNGNFSINLDVGGGADTMLDITSAATLALSQFVVFVPFRAELGIHSLSSDPYIRQENSSAALDEKIWQFDVDGPGTWFLRTRNDADSSGNDAITITRTGIVVDAITFGATTVNTNALSVTGNISVTGTVDGVEVAELADNVLTLSLMLMGG